MKDLRNRAARLGHEALDRLRSALNITSPSRTFADLRWDKLTIDGTPWPPVAPLPWYAARAPREPYASPELRRAARRVRRLIRRHWFALLFDPTSPEAMAVRAAMASPLREQFEAVERATVCQQMRALLDAGKIEVNDAALGDIAKSPPLDRP